MGNHCRQLLNCEMQIAMKIKIFSILLPLIFSVGCTFSRITPTGNYQPSEIVTIITKSTPTYSNVTDTSFPTSISSSAEPNKQPTSPSENLAFTVVPTFLPEESLDLVSEFLLNNGNCQLPCIWGFIPSKTDVQSFKTFADKFGEIDKVGDKLIISSFYEYVGGISFFWWVGNIRNFINFDYFVFFGRI